MIHVALPSEGGRSRSFPYLQLSVMLCIIIRHASRCDVSPWTSLPSCPKNLLPPPPHTHSFLFVWYAFANVLHLFALQVSLHCLYWNCFLLELSKPNAHNNSLKFLPPPHLSFSYFNFQTWFLSWKVVSSQYFLLVYPSFVIKSI